MISQYNSHTLIVLQATKRPCSTETAEGRIVFPSDLLVRFHSALSSCRQKEYYRGHKYIQMLQTSCKTYTKIFESNVINTKFSCISKTLTQLSCLYLQSPTFFLPPLKRGLTLFAASLLIS